MRTHVRCCLQLFLAPVLFVLTGCTATSPTAVATPATSPPTLTALSVTPAVQAIFQDSFVQFTATGMYSDGTTVAMTTQVLWSDSSPAAATITSAGRLYATLPGSVTVTATVGLLAATATVTVTAPANVPASFTTSIVPALGDDLAGPCTYDLQLFDTTHPVTGVWIIFERSDSAALWLDPGLRDLAARHRLALLYAHQCNALSFNDIQPDAAKGPARALTAALNLLAGTSAHAEIASAPISLFGFSAAGILSLTTAEAMPTRIATVVAYASGSVSLELRQLTPSTAQLKIPILLLANSDDNQSGDTMTGVYFHTGSLADAPWAFAIQPGVAHCCNLSTAPILLPWMDAILPLRTPALTLIDATFGWMGTYTCTPDGIIDGLGYTDCRITAANIRSGLFLPSDSTVWLPDGGAAAAWLAWVGNPTP